MFENIGRKIKTLAKVTCWAGISISVIGGIVLFCLNSYRMPTLVWGFVVLFGGSLLSWIGSFFAYGLGQLIENTDKLVLYQDMAYYAERNQKQPVGNVRSMRKYYRPKTLEDMVREGNITEAEYQQLTKE